MFWQHQDLQDVLTLLALVGWGTTLLLLLLVPGLMGVIWAAYKYKRSEAVPVYIARFVPYTLFVQLMSVSRSLLLALVAFSWLRDLGCLPEEEGLWALLRYVAYMLGILWGLNVLRAWGFELWSAIFMPREASFLLRQDFVVISLLLTLTLIPLSLLVLVPGHSQLAMSLCLGLIGLSILLRSLQVLRRLVASSGGYIYIFLYLCTHEWLPWCYIALGLRYAYIGA